MGKAIRVAYGYDCLAGIYVRAVPHGKGGQIFRTFKLEHSEIEVRVGTTQFGRKLAPVLQTHLDVRAGLDHMGVCEHQGLLAVHDDTGAKACPLALPWLHAEIPEKLLKGGERPSLHARACDVHDCR